MVTRIFRVRIDASKRAEFERDFTTISVAAVESQRGFLSVQIGKPTRWAPDEYVMISRWSDENAIRNFVGDSWNEAHIPNGMEQYVIDCWVHHYFDF